jgi:uncharacterized integral membrane protein
MPGRIRLIFGLLVVGLLVLFIVQNSEPVMLNFLVWEMSVPVAVVVAIPFLSGMLAGGLFAWREQRKEIREHQLHGSPTLSALATTNKKKRNKWWW